MFCHKTININPHIATYCQLEFNHSGKCSIEINPTSIVKLGGQHAFQSWCHCDKCLSFKQNASGGLPKRN